MDASRGKKWVRAVRHHLANNIQMLTHTALRKTCQECVTSHVHNPSHHASIRHLLIRAIISWVLFLLMGSPQYAHGCPHGGTTTSCYPGILVSVQDFSNILIHVDTAILQPWQICTFMNLLMNKIVKYIAREVGKTESLQIKLFFL